MLVKTSDIQVNIQSQVQEYEPVTDVIPGTSPGYIKYGLYARKTMFFHAFYKAFHLESFKANRDNARILADILSNLLKYFLQNPESWTIITTPCRAHTERLGYHFASEVLKITAADTGINFIPDLIGARDKNKIEPVFYLLKPIPQLSRLILFDDILTTGKTIYTTLDLIKPNPAAPNPLIIVGINNN